MSASAYKPEHQITELPLANVRLVFDSQGALLDAIAVIDGQDIARLPLMRATFRGAVRRLGEWDLTAAAAGVKHTTVGGDE